MKNNIFIVVLAVLTVGVMSLVSVTPIFADEHGAEEAAPMAEEPKTTGWFQLDVDGLGTYFLIGATHPLGSLSVASNIYVNGHYGELDVGIAAPVVTNDSLTLILQPMLGVGFDYTGIDGPDALFPQVFAFLPAGKIFGFHWTIGTIRTLFDSEEVNQVYNRTYITYALNDTIAIGPQIETLYGFGEQGGLWALNFGPRLNIGYGDSNTLGLYLGYDTGREEGETGLTGRMNFTRRW